MFSSIFTTATTTEFTTEQFLLCTGVSVGLGLLVALAYWIGGRASKPLAIALVVLPAIVQVIILMVNGNLGAGVAVAGAFSLVRFRSVPGSAREISFIFLAMAIGLATGMGYLGFAALITITIGVVLVILGKIPQKSGRSEKLLKILMPEDLDYTTVFDDILQTYTSRAELERIKTTNLGSMFEASYVIVLKDPKKDN